MKKEEKKKEEEEEEEEKEEEGRKEEGKKKKQTKKRQRCYSYVTSCLTLAPDRFQVPTCSWPMGVHRSNT